MEKKRFEKKEGEPRISVRPGNFIVPGEGAPDKNASREAEQSRPNGNAKKHNRRRGGRRPHGGQQSKDQQSAVKNQQSAAQKPTPEKKNGPQKPVVEKKNAPQAGRKDRRHGDRQKARKEQAAAAQKQQPEISKTLRRELDAQFSSPAPLSLFSPVARAEKQLQESGSAVDTKEFEVDIATAAYLVDDVPCGFPVPDGKAVEVIGVRFRGAGKIYFFDPGKERFRIGEAAIVDTARGEEFGEVVMLNRKMAQKDIVQPLRSVLRRATKEDIAHDAENHAKEKEALKLCGEKIAAHKLDMNLVDAQYTFDNSKLLFYFTAEGRVDFRELVRDLASAFRTRIELRQIGIRDEARLIGGLGMCGRPFCCATFLSDFGQVSVKMAKEQGLSINTAKISGCCGRLMCCLRYEHESYAAEIALTPKKDARVMTPDGMGTVVDAAPLTGMVKVRLDSAPEAVPTAYHRDTLKGEAGAKVAPAPTDNESTIDPKTV